MDKMNPKMGMGVNNPTMKPGKTSGQPQTLQNESVGQKNTPKQVMVIMDYLNLRKSPIVKHGNEVKVLEYGDILNVHGESNGWLNVSIYGTDIKGYVMSSENGKDYVRKKVSDVINSKDD